MLWLIIVQWIQDCGWIEFDSTTLICMLWPRRKPNALNWFVVAHIRKPVQINTSCSSLLCSLCPLNNVSLFLLFHNNSCINNPCCDFKWSESCSPNIYSPKCHSDTEYKQILTENHTQSTWDKYLFPVKIAVLFKMAHLKQEGPTEYTKTLYLLFGWKQSVSHFGLIPAVAWLEIQIWVSLTSWWRTRILNRMISPWWLQANKHSRTAL